MKTKKGSLADMFIWMAVGFIIVVFFASYMYGHHLLTNALVSLGAEKSTAAVNISYATQVTFLEVDVGLNALRPLAFFMIFLLGISIFIHNFLVKVHPAFFIVYLFTTVAAIIFAVYISNAYEHLMANSTLGTSISSFTGASFIMLHLPLWATIIGFAGAIFLFAGIMRDRGAGGPIA